MAAQKTVLVTGANKGLGFAILTVAGIRDPSSHYILACRNLEAGAKAIDDLKESGSAASLELLQLDITNDEEIAKAVESVTTKHGKLDVLINNAGISRRPDTSLPSIRKAYNELFDVNVSSVACMCEAFRPLLAKSTHPKVINITSGLASMSNALDPNKKMARSAPYGSSKVALNGLTAHLQTIENDRVALERDQSTAGGGPKVNYYVAAPGFLKTAFTRFNERGKDPLAGAEVVVHLLLDNQYPGGTQWEFVGDKMQQVPW